MSWIVVDGGKEHFYTSPPSGPSHCVPQVTSLVLGTGPGVDLTIYADAFTQAFPQLQTAIKSQLAWQRANSVPTTKGLPSPLRERKRESALIGHMLTWRYISRNF